MSGLTPPSAGDEQNGKEIFAPAKLNLALQVTGRRADGYHLLDSLVVFLDCGDRISILPSPAMRLKVEGPMAAGVPVDENNLLLKTVHLLAEEYPKAAETLHLTLSKHLPSGAGLGGGSADAAALLAHLRTRWKLPLADTELAALGLRLGADVPVCLMRRPLRMSGIGEVLRPLDLPALGAFSFLLVWPGAPVSTPAVFQALSPQGYSGPLPEPGVDMGGDPEKLLGWLAACRNDLEVPALAVAPVIGEALAALRAAPGCRLARMSGSGSACFGVFLSADEAERAGETIRREHPDWWVRRCRLWQGG